MVIGLKSILEDDEFADHCYHLCLATQSYHISFFSAFGMDALVKIFADLGIQLLSTKASPNNNNLQKLELTVEQYYCKIRKKKEFKFLCKPCYIQYNVYILLLFQINFEVAVFKILFYDNTM